MHCKIYNIIRCTIYNLHCIYTRKKCIYIWEGLTSEILHFGNLHKENCSF